MVNKKLYSAALLALVAWADAAPVTPQDTKTTALLINQCNFTVFTSFAQDIQAPYFFPVMAGTSSLMDVREVQGVSNGTWSFGRSEDATGLALEWNYASQSPNLTYRFALDYYSSNFIDFKNEMAVSGTNGASTSCESYNCTTGYSKCYWTEEYPADENCATPLDFQITLCAH